MDNAHRAMTERLRVPFVKVDTRFPDHPKVVGLSDAGFRLEVMAMCYAGGHLTDGHIPAAWVPRRLARSVPSLVDAQLWVPAPEGGWLLHDYLSWQTSRAEVEAIAKARAEAGRRGAEARWQRHGKP